MPAPSIFDGSEHTVTPTAPSAPHNVVETFDPSRSLYLRAVWARLMRGAMLAAFCAWIVAMLGPVRGFLIITERGHPIGLSLLGLAIVAAPLILWVCARLFARLAGIWSDLLFWAFAATCGIAVNTLAFLTVSDSVVSVFVLAGLGYGAINLLHRLVKPTPSALSALTFAAAALAGGYLITLVLPSGWPFVAADIAGVTLLAVLVLLRTPALERAADRLAPPPNRSGRVSFGALAMLGLAAPGGVPAST